EMPFLTRDTDGARVNLIHAGERFDEGGFAGTVLTHEREHLDRQEPEDHLIERLNTGELNRDAMHLDDRRVGQRDTLPQSVPYAPLMVGGQLRCRQATAGMESISICARAERCSLSQ